MDMLSFLNQPLMVILFKMMLLVGLLLCVTRLQISAKIKTLMWQIGLVFLIMLPCLHVWLPVIQLPVLPDWNQSQQVLEIPFEAASGSVANIANSMVLMSLGLLLASVSVTLLLLISLRIYRLNCITLQAKPMTKRSNLSVIAHVSKLLNMTKKFKVLISKHVDTPCTWGVIRPVILLPADINDSKTLRVILLHEMAHIKRKDWLWLMLSQVLVALFWFNPLVWFVQKQMINSSEAACDELVLQQQIPPSQYAEALLAFHQTKTRMQALTTNMATQSVMYQRLNQILTPRRITMKKRNQSWLTASLLMTFLLLSVVQITAAHEGNHPKAEMLSAPPVPEAAPHPENPPTAPVAETAPTAIPQPEHPVKPASSVIPSAPVAKPTQPAIENPEPEATEVERLRHQEARMKAAEFRVRKEERDNNREQLRIERNLSRLENQRVRTIASQQKIKELRQQAQVRQLRSKELEEKAKMARLKALEHKPEPTNNPR